MLLYIRAAHEEQKTEKKQKKYNNINTEIH